MAKNGEKLTRRALLAAGISGCGAALAYEIAAGCRHNNPGPAHPHEPKQVVTFTDITAAAGIDFQHVNGAFGQKWLPETMGSGLAWIDYDNDGYQDLFIVNSRDWAAAERVNGHQPPGEPAQSAATCKLYHNNGNGTFTDVTKQAKLNIPMYGMGVCVGDYDNDGYPDLFVTTLTRCYLFRNNGNGTFTDVTQMAGVVGHGWSTSAAFVDYDKDGHLDLFVCHYVNWTPATNLPSRTNGHLTYTTPVNYVGIPPTLYHNNGNGTFTDVTVASGILDSKPRGKSLGVAILDYDNDGWPDIAVANDTEPNYLFHNLKNGRFEEVGSTVGVAYTNRGAARGAMGIDSSDYDRSGFESLAIGNYSNQQLALYHNDGGASFHDVASQDGLGPASEHSLSFGLFFVDLDNDGLQDLFVANGHVDDDIQETHKNLFYAEQPLIFRNIGAGNFRDISNDVGGDFTRKVVGRGAAAADFNLDGYVDVAVSTNHGPAYLYKNGGCANRSLRLELEGAASNRSAIGAVVTVKVAGWKQSYRVHSGSSYCSQSELPITVGLGQSQSADVVTIAWPCKSGERTELTHLEAGKIYRIIEGKGIVDTRPFGTAFKKR